MEEFLVVVHVSGVEEHVVSARSAAEAREIWTDGEFISSTVNEYKVKKVEVLK